jgi:hypothetical protein
METINETIESDLCEQMTGCDNAGRYRDFARSKGFQFCEVYDWTSSAGDWTFIVSKDQIEWFVMSQTNNWPRPGFTREIDYTLPFYGRAEDVLTEIYEMLA